MIGVLVFVGVFAYFVAQFEKLHRVKKAAASQTTQSQPLVHRTQSPVSEQSVLVHESEPESATFEIADFRFEPSIQPSQVPQPLQLAPAASTVHPSYFDNAAPISSPSTRS